MSAWMIWLSLAGIVVILELFSGTFYLLMIALGLFSGAIAAWFGSGIEMALLMTAIVGALSTLALHKSRFGWKRNRDATRDPNVNMDIGQSLSVQEWHDQGNGKFTARTMYRGALWDVELQHSAGFPGVYVIEEVQGSRLLVRPG